MKKIFLYLFFALSSALSVFSQTPQTIPYQAVARNASGNLLVNQSICVQFRIYNQLTGGTLLYEEHQTATTNNLGLFTLNIGSGSYDGGTASNLSGIAWGSTSVYTEIGIDLTGACSGYTTLARSQMLSVPYALYAGSAGSAGGSAGGDLTGTYPNPTIASNKVTYADIQKENTATILGNNSGGLDSPSEITLGAGLGFNGANQIINTSPDQTVGFTNGNGISVTGSYPNFTVTNTKPDQTVSISGTGITVGGAYPSFSLTTNNNGTVTSVGTTSPITGGTISGSGTIACPTCVTSTSGGAITGTAPVAVSAAGVVSCAACITTSTLTGFAAPANKVGISATAAGSASTAIRSDATLTIDQTIAPTWTGTHTFSNGTYSALFTGGNVGIGTATPVNKLQVEGNLHMDGHPIYLRSNPADNYDFVEWGEATGGSGNDRVDIAGYNGVDLGYSSPGTGITTVLSIAGNLVNIPGLAANSEVYTDGSSNLTTTVPTGGISWFTKGNTGTTPTSYSDGAAQTNNFMGTTDNQSVNIYTNASSATAKSNLTLVTSTSTGAAITAPADILQIRRNGTAGVNYPGVASFALGKYAADINSESVLAIKLGNGGVYTPDVTVMTMQGNGAVGIGTTSPGSNLLNVSSSTASGFGINLAAETGVSNGNGGGVSISAGAGNGAANGGSVTITSGANGSSSNGGSSGSVNITGANAGASAYGVGGGSVNISAGSAYNAGGSGIGGSVNITAGGNTLGANSYGNINFYTYANSGTSTSEAMFISGSNNDIGIGTTSPSQTLSVNGSQGIWNSNELSFYTDNGATQHGFVGEYSSGSDMSIAAVTSGNWLRLGSNNANIAFFPNGTINSSSNPLDYISSTGTLVASQFQVGTSNSSGGTNGTTINHMEAGLTNIGMNSGTGVKTVTVTLNFPSGVTPNMVCTVVSQPGTNYSDTYVAHVRSISNNTATINIYRVDSNGGGWGQSPNLSWMAWY